MERGSDRRKRQPDSAPIEHHARLRWVLGSHRELELMRVPPRHRQGEEPSARHRVGPWIPVTPVDLVPALAGGDMRHVQVALHHPAFLQEIEQSHRALPFRPSANYSAYL